jgi:hypothetical protein
LLIFRSFSGCANGSVLGVNLGDDVLNLFLGLGHHLARIVEALERGESRLLSKRSGEEAAFRLMRSLATLMDDAVRAQGGVVQGFTGDGIMAVFGAPVALEDAPLRACRAALAILQELWLLLGLGHELPSGREK